MLEYPYLMVQLDPAVREAELVFNRISELASQNADLLRDLECIDARRKKINLELARLVDRLERLHAGTNSVSTARQ